MKPKNARERKIYGLYRSLPHFSKAQKEWINDSVVERCIFTSGHRCWCSRCGGEWRADVEVGTEQVCPDCGIKAKVEKSRRIRWDGFTYAQFFQVYKGFQVIRYTVIRWSCEKGRKQRVYDMDVIQKWCQPGKPVVTLGAPLGMNCYWRYIPYSYWGGMSIKGSHTYFYQEWMKVKTYPRMSLLPVYVKNLGRRPDFSHYDAPTLLGDIFGCPYLESLYKEGETKELNEMLQRVESLNKYWPSVKVALRHGYSPDSWSVYFEHLRYLKYLHYDMHSPRYVAPPDFGELHYLLSCQYRNKMEEVRKKAEAVRMLRWAIEEEEHAKRRAREAEEYAQSFAERMSHFAKLQIEDTDIVIAPLMTIPDFKEEGDAMRHCVFNGSYWKKEDSLILSARMKADGSRVETIEVSLENYTILQSQGYLNNPTPRHEEIRRLVEGAMPKIKRMAIAI